MFIGYIYKITGSCGKVYIGSTRNYKNRVEQHRFDKGERSNSKLLVKPLKFEIIRQDEYKLVKTMYLVEQFYIDINDCVNQQRAFGRRLEIREYKKEYNIKNKKKISDWQKVYRETHKEELKEKSKVYRETHKEELKKKKKVYSETHKEYFKEKCKEYRETHKEEIKKKMKKYWSIKIECIYCKKIILKGNICKHHKTKRCLAIQESLKDAK